jgi:hypothetical protein
MSVFCRGWGEKRRRLGRVFGASRRFFTARLKVAPLHGAVSGSAPGLFGGAGLE